MKINSKILIPNKEWIIKTDDSKLGSISKVKKGFNFLKKGQKIFIKSIDEIQNFFGIEINESILKTSNISYNLNQNTIYDFPCSSKPYEPIFNIKKKLPLFTKSSKSKSKYCAGYYVIKFRKGWVKSFCPKLITLERYPYCGPYKTEQEMKSILYTLNKNETIKHITY